MPQINSLLVTDFQSIKKAKVNFASKPSGGSVTTIVGPSSTGKSALLRALRMLLYNTSSAPVRIQDSPTKTTVTADVDGTPIRVERGKSLSTYFIGTEKYSKAGTSVPQPVQNILKIDYATPLINHSTQFDKPYLLDETGTTVSAIIGKLTHANTLRLAVKEGNRRSLESSRLLKTRLSDLEKAREQLTEFSWVDTSLAAVSDVHELIGKYSKLETRRAKALDEVERVQYYSQKHTEASQNVSDHPDVSSEVESATLLLERCKSVYSIVSMVNDKLYFYKKQTEEKPVTLDDTEISVLESHYEKLRAVHQLVQNISAGLQDYKAINTKLTNVKEESNNVSEIYLRTLRGLGKCPTCGADTRTEER